MTILASPLIVCTLLAAPLEVGEVLEYQGEVVADRDEDAARKQIHYQLLVAEADGDQTRLLWTVAEKGQGGWPWIEQFGSITTDRRGKILDGKPASVLYEHADGLSPVPLPAPLFGGPKGLADGANWRSGRLQFDVRAPEDDAAARQSWEVDVSTAIGRKSQLLVEKQRGLVTVVEETVFMGPGKKHHLRLALVGGKKLTGEVLAQTIETYDALAALREKLGVKAQGGKVQWRGEQLALLKKELPAIIEASADTPLAEMALRAGGDAKLQHAVAAAVAKLSKQFVGQQTPKLNLPPASLSGNALKTAELKGRPVVLHVWSYRDNPLVEPYGQVGYLDFLHRQHKDAGVAVYGIAVDERLDRRETRSAAVRSVRKLRSLMNVEYPIVLGGSDVLEKLGDPTQFGAELPLWLVIDAEGKIVHYHVGLYDVDPQRGLTELSDVVEQATKR